MDQKTIESNATPASSPEEAGVVLSELVDSFTPEDVERVLAAQRAFPAQIATAWLTAGYAVIPAKKGGKDPAPKFLWIKDTARDYTTECLQKEIEEGAFTLSARAVLVLDGLKGSPELSVMDLDVANMEATARSRLPVTPLEVTTGRVGGGRHFYYRRDPAGAQRGSRTGLSTVGCDYKGRSGLTVAPGSIHATGLVYRAFWEGVEIAPDAITAEMLASLPTLPDALVQQFVDEDVQAKRAAKAGFHDLSMEKGKRAKTTQSGLERVKADADKATFRHGPLKGQTVAQAAQQLGSGRHYTTCPHDGHKTDANGKTTAILNVSASGEAQVVTCLACSKVFLYGSGFGQVLPFAPKGKTPKADKGFEIVTNEDESLEIILGETFLDVKGRINWPLVYKTFPQAFERNTMIIRAGQSRGKTWLAQGLTKNLLAKGKKVVAVSPTRSLVADLSTKLTLPSYADTEGWIDGSVACCLPSLPRSRSWRIDDDGEVQPYGADLFMVDEIEQAVASLLGSHLKDSKARAAWSALVSHTHSAGRRLFLDADAGDGVKELLKQAKIAGSDIVWIVAPNAASRTVEVSKTRTEAWASILKAGKAGRLAVGVQSLKEAHALGKALARHQGLPTLVISQDTVGDLDLSKINALLLGYGHLIYTPSLGTGVSIDLEDHFQSVWLLISDSVGTATSALQMACRVRHPVDSTLRVARLGPGKRPERWEADPKEVIARWAKREVQGMKRAGFVRVFPDDYAFPTDENLSINPAAASYVKAMAVAHSSQVKAGLGCVVDALLSGLTNMGWTVVEAGEALTAKEVVKTAKVRGEARKEVKQEDVASVTDAPDLEPEQLVTLAKRGPKSRCETLGMRRASLDRAYGPGSADDAAVVGWDDRGKRRGKMRAYAEMTAWSEGGLAREALRRADRIQLEAGVSAPRLAHRAMKGAVRAYLLNRVFASVGGVVQHFSIVDQSSGSAGPGPIPLEAAKNLALFLLSPVGRELGSWVGVTVREDGVNNPMPVVSSLMRSCGLSLKSSRPRSGDDRVRVYELDLDDLGDVQARAGHYLNRLRAGLVGQEEAGDEETLPDAQLLSVEAQGFAQAVMSDLMAA